MEHMKTCVRCEKSKPLTEFGEARYKTKTSVNSRVKSYCKACFGSYERIRKYGVSDHAYASMLSEQWGCCAICRTTVPGRRDKFFAVDHNHTTGAVRGLLCQSCNRAIGLLKDDPSILRAAATYLEVHQ